MSYIFNECVRTNEDGVTLPTHYPGCAGCEHLTRLYPRQAIQKIIGKYPLSQAEVVCQPSLIVGIMPNRPRRYMFLREYSTDGEPVAQIGHNRVNCPEEIKI